jgi:hypothetical protein
MVPVSVLISEGLIDRWSNVVSRSCGPHSGRSGPQLQVLFFSLLPCPLPSLLLDLGSSSICIILRPVASFLSHASFYMYPRLVLN